MQRPIDLVGSRLSDVNLFEAQGSYRRHVIKQVMESNPDTEGFRRV